MRSLTIFLVVFVVILTSCKENEKMENKTNFSYDISITAPEEYPVEIHMGYLSSGKKFITDIINTGEEKQGWIYDGNTQSGGSTIPDFLDLTWISYAEKKFWNLETPLPADKILALFRKGFIYKNSKDSITTETYGQIIIGTAPGGVVVVWLDGSVKRVEVGRYQAVETFVDKKRFQPVVDTTETQEQFLETWYKLAITNETKEEIKKHGIPLVCGIHTVKNIIGVFVQNFTKKMIKINSKILLFSMVNLLFCMKKNSLKKNSAFELYPFGQNLFLGSIIVVLNLTKKKFLTLLKN